MSLSPSAISITLLTATAIILLFVTQCQRAQLSKRAAAIEAAQAQSKALQEQLDLSQATLEADRKRIIEIARRFDMAITNYTEGATTAHETHETRMDELAHMESAETVDWMCEPVPDDIRRLFGCDTYASGSDGSDAAPAAGSSHAALHQTGTR